MASSIKSRHIYHLPSPFVACLSSVALLPFEALAKKKAKEEKRRRIFFIINIFTCPSYIMSIYP